MSTATRQRILEAARQEFYEKGFVDASLRSIARTAECTVGNIYRYFASKDTLFCQVLAPLTEEISKLMNQHYKDEDIDLYYRDHKHYEALMIDTYVPILNNYKREWRLLLTQSYGTSMETFIEVMKNSFCDLSLRFIDTFKKKYESQECIPISESFIRLSISWWISLMRQIVTDETMSEEEIRHLFAQYTLFCSAGWRVLLGIPQEEE